MQIRLILADDHILFLEGLKLILSNVADYTIVATATDGFMTKSVIEEVACDVVLMDLHMPGISGYELCKQIKAQRDLPKIIIVSMADEPSVIEKLFQAGADAYVLKNGGAEELKAAISSVMEDLKYLSPEITQKYGFKAPEEIAEAEHGAELTKREIEILQYIIRGYTNPEIAEILFLSTPTVQTHRKNMQSKLGLKNTASLVKYGLDNKLILGLE